MRHPCIRNARTLWSDRGCTAGRIGDNSVGLSSIVSGDGRSAVWPGLPRLDGVLQTGGLAQRGSGSVFGGRQQSPRARRADGGDVGPPSRGQHRGGLHFDGWIPSDGYAWWYVDALSDDGAHGLTLIAFVGSVFSPYYAWARRGGSTEPNNHCAFNVALYGSRSSRWAMTERGSAEVRREPRQLSIGASSMRWSGDALEISVNEVCVPLPRRVRGTIRLIPSALCERSFSLDGLGLHLWTPFAPCARIEVALSQPELKWGGVGYFDSNSGT